MYRRIRNPGTRVSKPISAWKAPARRKNGSPENEDKMVDSTPSVPSPNQDGLISSQTLAKLQTLKYHETTQDLLASSPKRGVVTVFPREEAANSITFGKWDQDTYAEFVSKYDQDANSLDSPATQPDLAHDYQSCTELPLEDYAANDGDNGNVDFNMYMAEGTQEIIEANEPEEQTDNTLTNADDIFGTPTRDKQTVNRPVGCYKLSAPQGSYLEFSGIKALTPTRGSDDEFDIDPDVFGGLDETRQLPKNFQDPVVSPSMHVQCSPASSERTIVASGNYHTCKSFQEPTFDQENVTLNASSVKPDWNLHNHGTVLTPPQERTKIGNTSLTGLQIVDSTVVLDHAPMAQAHPTKRPPIQPSLKRPIQKKNNATKQPKADKPRPFVRRAFPLPVSDRSPIQGLTSTHTLLRTCFRIGEALMASLAPSASTMIKSKSDSPSLPSQVPRALSGSTTATATATVLVELYALVESSHRINKTQYFTFADLFFPSRPPYLAGVWEGCADSVVFDDDGRAFLGDGGREWRWDETKNKKAVGRKRKIREMQDEDDMGVGGFGGRKMCRVIGVIEKNWTGNGMAGVVTSPGCSGDVVIMTVLSIWKADWSDVEHVKGIVEA